MIFGKRSLPLYQHHQHQRIDFAPASDPSPSRIGGLFPPRSRSSTLDDLPIRGASDEGDAQRFDREVTVQSRLPQ